MATQTITKLIDDLDGTSEADETVHFGLDGRSYEMELTEQHADELRDQLQPYIDVARKSGASVTPKGRPAHAGNGRLSKEEAAEIRQWVRQNGGTIGDRGRIPARFVDAYSRRDPSIFAVGDDEDDDQLPEAEAADDDFDEAKEELVGVGAAHSDPFSTS